MAEIFSSTTFVHPLQQEAEHCERVTESSGRTLGKLSQGKMLWGSCLRGNNTLLQLISLLSCDSRPTPQRRKPQHLLATNHLLCKAAGQSFAGSFSAV